MIRHIVAWRPKDGSDTTAVEAALDFVVRLESEADGVWRASWTKNAYFRDRGFTHVVVGDFTDEAAVERWVASEPHAQTGLAVRDLMQDFTVVDIEEPFAFLPSA